MGWFGMTTRDELVAFLSGLRTVWQEGDASDDVAAEAKATNATDAGRRLGYPLLFTTEPEE
jgi:hypothetical protein